MNDSQQAPTPISEAADSPTGSDDQAAAEARQRLQQRKETRRWWIKLVLQPVLLLGAGALLLAGLGVAQHLGWLPSSDGEGGSTASADTSVRYICPMMCTPAQSEPGRCPVCAMELVRATSGSGDGGSLSIEIDPAARRIAGIQTVAVKTMPASRPIRTIGELSYDEGTLKTISAYVAGRIERLYADYTGVVVQQGDQLALVYSPRLYSGQIEYLSAKNNSGASRSTTLQRAIQSGGSLQESARQRLIEFGMTETQISELERTGVANSRLHVGAPISGTVIEKLAAEGDYVKEGQPIYRLADLSTVWLMLELFPDDAATIRYGQKVEAMVQSLPGETYTGRVAFVDPNVNPKTRTVGVRVVIPNPRDRLRVGDYAKATVNVPWGRFEDESNTVYDPELADKWISPRHPHIVRSTPGVCPICGVDLVPAAEYGFTGNAETNRHTIAIPRDAVLMAGDNSVVYVEVEPGRFEIRRVTLGTSSGEHIAVLDGLEEGELVAVRGNFLIDSQMQLAGNPSLIDPSKIESLREDALPPNVIEALAKLSPEDRTAAERQRICPVSEELLGSMGTPPKIDVNGRTIYICCMGCKKPLLAEPDKYLANLDKQTDPEDEVSGKIRAALAKLPPEDRALAERQRTCPVADMPLGSMGTPVKVDVNGTPVFLCCGGCRAGLMKDPERYLAKLAAAPSAESASKGQLPVERPPDSGPETDVEDRADSKQGDPSNAARELRDVEVREKGPAKSAPETRKEAIR